jgi:hypothetical protein
MPEREVMSPISRRGSKVGSGQPLSPGARSAPSHRGDQATSHEPEPPLHERGVQGADKPAEPGTTGPAAAARGASRGIANRWTSQRSLPSAEGRWRSWDRTMVVLGPKYN